MDFSKRLQSSARSEAKLQQRQTPEYRPLWVVFWIHGVLISIIFFAAILALFQHIGQGELTLLLAAFVAYTARILRSIWSDPLWVGNRYWLRLARALTVAWVLNVVLVSVFLLLGQIGADAVPF